MKCIQCDYVKQLVKLQSKSYRLWFSQDDVALNDVRAALRLLHGVIEGDDWAIDYYDRMLDEETGG